MHLIGYLKYNMEEICMKKKPNKILIVDDNISSGLLIKQIFTDENYEIESYTNPVDALIYTERKKYDILLVDIVMPEMDGFEFAKSFALNHPETPVVFISGYGNTEKNQIKSYDMGSFGYIQKPLNAKTIKAKIKNIIKTKLLKDELLREKEKLDNIFRFSSDEIILTDGNFDIITKNNRFFPINMKNFLETLKSFRLKKEIDLIKQFISSRQKHTSLDINIPGYCTNANLSKIYDTKGVRIGFLIIIRDITQSVMVERQKKQFIATLTHDLKTPVRAEERAIKMLIDGNFGEIQEEQKEILKEILSSSKFMGRMTDNLLTRYKIENDSFRLNKELNSLKNTIEKCVENIKYILESKNQTLKINYNTANEYFIYDEIEFSRVIINLISNASEYSKTGKNIIFTILEEDNKLQLKVKDNGYGIPDDEIEHIFDEFYSSAKRFRKVGSGLGLFITKKIIEAHNGSISVESTYGEGSEFTILLPLEKSLCV